MCHMCYKQLTSEQERLKRAATMLLNGATLLSQPCPYCKGVRVIRGGNAMCVSCGQEPEERQVPQDNDTMEKKDTKIIEKTTIAHIATQHNSHNDTHNDDGSFVDVISILEDKLVTLSKELAAEKTDRQKEIEILDSINAVLQTLEKAKDSLKK